MLNRLPGAARGVTLIELLIGLAVLGIVLMIGLPYMGTWLQNTRIRNSAESLLNGLQLSRAEALRRNAPVEFVLTDADPTAANAAATGVSTGRNWIVRSAAAGGAYTAADFIQGGGSAEAGSAQVLIESRRETSSGSSSADVDTIRFNGLGRATALNQGALPPWQWVRMQVTNPAGGNCVSAATPGPMRCLTVEVRVGGQVRMCDPAVTDNTDPRFC